MLDREQLQATLALMDARIYQWHNAVHRASRLCVRCGDYMLLRRQRSSGSWVQSGRYEWSVVHVWNTSTGFHDIKPSQFSLWTENLESVMQLELESIPWEALQELMATAGQ